MPLDTCNKGAKTDAMCFGNKFKQDTYSGVNSACREENRQNRHVLCNCSGRGKHKSGYNICIISDVTSLNIKLYICDEKLRLLWCEKLSFKWEIKLQLKPEMNFLGHALCKGGCMPHKSTFAPQGDVWHWHPPPWEKKLHNWQKCKS